MKRVHFPAARWVLARCAFSLHTMWRISGFRGMRWWSTNPGWLLTGPLERLNPCLLVNACWTKSPSGPGAPWSWPFASATSISSTRASWVAGATIGPLGSTGTSVDSCFAFTTGAESDSHEERGKNDATHDHLFTTTVPQSLRRTAVGVP